MPQSFGGDVPGIPGALVRDVASLPDRLEGGRPAGHHAEAKSGEFLMVMPEVGRFRVRGGTTIEVALENGADPGSVRLLLNGTARGALIHQRGELPLHAASLAPPDGGAAVAVCGASGFGKSTLAVELSRRGWKLLADDTTRVTWNGGRAVAWPSREFIKLWRDACETLAVDTASIERVSASLDKYYVPVPAQAEPCALGCVFEITADGIAPGPVLSAGERMALLTRHTYRPKQIPPLGVAANYARLLAKVASATRLFRLGPSRSQTPAAFADRIEEILRA